MELRKFNRADAIRHCACTIIALRTVSRSSVRSRKADQHLRTLLCTFHAANSRTRYDSRTTQLLNCVMHDDDDDDDARRKRERSCWNEKRTTFNTHRVRALDGHGIFLLQQFETRPRRKPSAMRLDSIHESHLRQLLQQACAKATPFNSTKHSCDISTSNITTTSSKQTTPQQGRS